MCIGATPSILLNRHFPDSLQIGTYPSTQMQTGDSPSITHARSKSSPATSPTFATVSAMKRHWQSPKSHRYLPHRDAGGGAVHSIKSGHWHLGFMSRSGGRRQPSLRLRCMSGVGSGGRGAGASPLTRFLLCRGSGPPRRRGSPLEEGFHSGSW